MGGAPFGRDIAIIVAFLAIVCLLAGAGIALVFTL